ncbi:MAG: translation initiation factor IF-2 [Desulfococcaceae bacterium]
MAKLRVYELARELNMKNKALLDKLDAMEIPVSSHMSSLDEDLVTRIKRNVLGKKGDPMEVTRVRPTVIRKRKKPREVPPPETAETENDIETEPVEATAEVEEVEAPSVEETVTEEVAEPVDRETETAATEETAAVEAEAEPTRTPAETQPAVEEETQPAAKKRPVEEADKAKIIRKPAPPKPPEPEKPAEEPVAEEAAASPAEPVEEEKPVEPSPEKPETEAPAEAETKTAPPEETEALEAPTEPAETTETESTETAGAAEAETPAEAEAEDAITAEAPAGEEAEKPAEKGDKKSKKKKKGKKEAPAKIITLPPKVKERVAEKVAEAQAASKTAEPTERRGGRQEVAVASDAMEQQDRRSKKGRKGEKAEPEAETRWAKKKISFKRKEVVEGSDLYGGRGKKGKKGPKGKAAPKGQKPQITTPKAIKRRIKVDDTIMLSDLAKRMGIKANEMIKKLMMLGVMATVNQTIDYDTAALVASEFGYEVERASFEEQEILEVVDKDIDPETAVERPPVVTIMGHVDHGKTSLLDVIRKTRVTEGEAGGITQHIGAYSVSTEGGQITFLDTPGHEAFTSMRARGATVTDIVVLVVAADDGVMPQTIEAINHSKAAEVPIIVAVNKMDKAGADPDRVMRELSEQGLVPEDWGGDTIFVQVSAKQNTGIESLLEMILLQSEFLELKANPEKHGLGYVVEAKLDSGRGPVATILVQDGTLRAGEPVVCGVHHGKIRAMVNDLGEFVDEAGPAVPVEILGLSGVPNAGDELVAVEDDKSAKQVSEHRLQKQRSLELAKTSRVSLEGLFERMKEGEVKDLNIIIKADVHGSIEALSDSLVKLSNEEVSIQVIHSGTGTVNESDISLAAVSEAIIIGFNVRPSAKVQALANEEQVDMRFYNIIYNVIKDVKDAILGMMESTYEERVLGRAEVRQVFYVPKVGAVAGCYVTDGKIERGRLIRLVRDGIVVHEGKIASLKRYKDDAKEVQHGYECGIGIEGYNDIKDGDVIECYYLEEIRPEL